MYDTIHMFYSFIENSIPSNQDVFKNCKNISRTEKENSSYMQGDLKNMKVTFNEGSISIKGSLSKYYFGNNFKTLSKKEIKEVIEMLGNDLNINISNSSISRIDFSTNLNTTYKPTIYYPFLGTLTRFSRLVQPSSIYYNQTSKRLLFYDKTKWAKQTRNNIPNEFIGKHLLRYELVINKNLKRFFNKDKVLLKHLTKDSIFRTLLNAWKEYYNKIEKQNTKQIKIMSSNIHTPKDLDKALLQTLIKQVGFEKVDRMIEELKAKNTFSHKEYYSRMKRKYRKMTKTHIDSDDMISEINKKVNEIYLSY
jgi:hypothetical protein